MFNKNSQIEQYKKVLAAQLEKRHQEDLKQIKEDVVKELKDYIDEVIFENENFKRFV